MALVNFKKGYVTNVDNVPLIDGQVLFTEDTNELIIDFLDGTNELKRVSVKDKELAQLLNTHIENLNKVENKSSEDIRNELTFDNVVAALGYSGAIFDPSKVDVFFGPLQVVKNGGDAGTPEADLVKVVSEKEFVIRCDFHDGDANHWIWTSDVSYEYVKINADYHT